MARPSPQTQLGVSFAVVAGLTALLVAGMLGVTWQQTFDAYIRTRVQSQAQSLSGLASQTYVPNRGWNDEALLSIAVLGTNGGLRVQVLDAGDAVLVDSLALGLVPGMPGMPEASEFVSLTTTRSAKTSLVSPVVRVPVYVGRTLVGSVRVASQSPGTFLSEQDTTFRSASIWGLLGVASLAVGLATAAGVAYSRVFSRPIARVTRTAASLRAGNLAARTGMEGEDPFGVLGRTLDEMADAIEAERQFERRLTADVAHELRTPLQAIQATVEAMQDGVMPADAEHLSVVRDETVRLGRMADSILELSRLENRTTAMRAAPLDLAEAVRRSVETHRALLESLGLTLVEELDDGAVVVGDTDRLAQAFGNLISNAAHYTPDGGTVTVRLVLRGNDALVSVVDTGIGIDEAERDHAFERFWRSGAARERSRGGFGIGLSIVREIVEQHRGSVSLAPNPDGMGTAATVRLPMVDRKGRQAV